MYYTIIYNTLAGSVNDHEHYSAHAHDQNDDILEQQSHMSKESDTPNLDGISIVVYDETVESGKPYEDEDLPKERLKSSITNLSMLYRPQSATSSGLITDDTNVTSPSPTTMTTYKSDFNSDTSNDTTRSSSATTASSTDGEVCIVHIVHIVYNSIIGCATSTIILS